MSRNLIFNTEFQNSIIPGNFQKFSGTLEIALELATFNWFQHIRYLFNSFLFKELDFQYGISKFYHSWKLPDIFSGYHPGIGYFYLISRYRVFFPPIFCQGTWFLMQNFKIPSILETSRRFLEFRILPWNWHWISFQESSGSFQD